MSRNPNIHQRRSIRMKGYDYAQAGLYFITICVQNRECLFGKIVGGAANGSHAHMILNDAGKMVETEWINLKTRFPNIALHEFVTMPNHFHGILEIVGAPLVGAQNNVGAPNNADAPNNVGAQNKNIAQNKTVAQNDNNNNAITGQPQNGQPQNGQPNGVTTRVTPTGKTVGDMIDAFKSITTVEYIRGVKTLGWQPFNGKLWQRNYWEHIIRNENDYNRIAEYIIHNPQQWENDQLNRSNNLSK